MTARSQDFVGGLKGQAEAKPDAEDHVPSWPCGLAFLQSVEIGHIHMSSFTELMERKP